MLKIKSLNVNEMLRILFAFELECCTAVPKIKIFFLETKKAALRKPTLHSILFLKGTE